MTIRLSTGFVNRHAEDQGARQLMSNCYLALFTGSQPSTADDAYTGQRIIEYTKAGGVFTGETLPRWKMTISGSSGSIDSCKLGGSSGWDLLGGAVTYSSSPTATAALVAAAINANNANVSFRATSSGADVYVIGPPGVGALMNSLVLTWGVTTLVATVAGDGTPSGSGGTAGVTCVNGLTFNASSAGIFSKSSSAVQGLAGYDRTGVAISGFSSGNLTAGWGRIYCDAADTDALSTTFARIDFSCGTVNADCILNPSASIAWNSTQTISSIQTTEPQSNE